MKVYKITTTTEKDNINDVFDNLPADQVPMNNTSLDEIVESFTDYRIRQNHPDENLLLLFDLLKSSALSELQEHQVIEVLKGKSYIKKKVTTEYFIIENDGTDLTEKMNDDYINYISSDNPESFPEDKQFTQVGNRIMSMSEYYQEKIAANIDSSNLKEKK